MTRRPKVKPDIPGDDWPGWDWWHDWWEQNPPQDKPLRRRRKAEK